MPVYRCYVCDRHPADKARYGDSGLAEGDVCPVCHQPVCRHHMVTVRWRWRRAENGTDAALICRECKRTYRHRNWDTVHRDWIT